MIGIIFGGESCEHDISVITALSTYNRIKKDIESILIYQKNGTFYVGEKLSNIETYKQFSAKGLREVYFKNGAIYNIGICKRKKVLSCILMCNHGGTGENGSLSGFFEVIGIPYTASGVFGSSACMDKAYTKLLLEKFKFPVVDYRIFRSGYKADKVDGLDYPLIIKPSRAGSSVGISYAKDFDELKKGIDFSLGFDNKLIIEKALQNFREFNCAAFEGSHGVVVSDVEEVFFKKDFLDFYDKYLDSEDTGRKIPAQIGDKLCERIKRMTKEIYLLFELKGVVRVDYLFADGKIFVNEINTIPGSLSDYMFKNQGISPLNIVTETVKTAEKDFATKKQLITDFSSDVLKHFDGLKGKGIKK